MTTTDAGGEPETDLESSIGPGRISYLDMPFAVRRYARPVRR